MMVPNVLCVGFAKCGTTTLYDILIQHPDIYLSGIKEPIYYGNSKFEKKGFGWYLSRYYPQKINEKIVMEINPVIGKYISAERIKKDYGENTKIIFLIRNPIKRLYSNFKMNLIKGDCFDEKKENIGDSSILFEKWVINNFLNDKLDVISGDKVPKFCKSGNYYKKISDYYNVFGRNNIKVVIFEDFISNPKKVCEELYDFMGIEPNDNINYSIHSNNGNRVVNNKFYLSLNRTFINKIWPDFFIKKFNYISFKFSSNLNKIVWNFPTYFTKINTNDGGISNISYNILEIYYKNMIKNLGNLLDIDLYKKWGLNNKPILLKEDILVAILKSKYSNELEKIKREYYSLSIYNNGTRLLSNMRKHQDLIICLLHDVLSFFTETRLCDCIFLNGSFSRLTCTYSSDVDLNLIYDDKYKDMLFPIELKINYVLSKLLNFRGCDRVHTMMVYTQKIGNCVVELCDNSYLKYKNTNINYFCRNNYQELLNDTFNTARNYCELINYLDDSIHNNIFKDWLYNFEMIYESDNKFIDYVNNNFKKTKMGSDFYDSIISEINLLIEKYSKKGFSSIYVENQISISKMKNRYKFDIMDAINNILLLLNYCYCQRYMNFCFLIDNRIIKKTLKKCILFAFTMITRLQIVLDILGYDLSSHSTDNLDEELFRKVYYKIYKSNYEIDLKKMEDMLYPEIINSLKKLKWEVKKNV